jgi:two-component system sensor histidine kinase HydH
MRTARFRSPYAPRSTDDAHLGSAAHATHAAHATPAGAATRDPWSVRRANRVRWLWLATTITLAAALVVGSFLTYRGVAAAATTLNRGQADVLEFALHSAFPRDAEITPDGLAAFGHANRTAGLRYVGVLDAAGRIVVSAGQPGAALPRAAPWPRAPALEAVDGRIRASFPRPPPHARSRAEDSTLIARLLSRRRIGGRAFAPLGSYLTVIEFVPVAPALVADAGRALVVAGVGAAILTLATLALWRTTRRYDAVRQRFEDQRRLAALGEMSAVLAHEIRNPLASLKGHAQLLAERLGDGSAEQRKAQRVVGEAKRLEVLTNDLLDFGRSGPMDVHPVDPAALLRACADELSPAHVTVDATEAPPRWRLDERRFCSAVLANLLRNAVQASPPDEPVEARVFAEHGRLVFTVRDHGAGLPDGQEARLFDPFFTTRTTGTGLGLAIARRIVELHGGRISAQNAAGGGALFRVELPASPGER